MATDKAEHYCTIPYGRALAVPGTDRCERHQNAVLVEKTKKSAPKAPAAKTPKLPPKQPEGVGILARVSQDEINDLYLSAVEEVLRGCGGLIMSARLQLAWRPPQ